MVTAPFSIKCIMNLGDIMFVDIFGQGSYGSAYFNIVEIHQQLECEIHISISTLT